MQKKKNLHFSAGMTKKKCRYQTIRPSGGVQTTPQETPQPQPGNEKPIPQKWLFKVSCIWFVFVVILETHLCHTCDNESGAYWEIK